MSGMIYDPNTRVSGEITNPFAKKGPSHLAAGTVAIESERAIAEAQGKLIIAKRFPRDEAAAFARAMDACRRPSLAAVANYKFPRGTQSVSGASIRLAEELARCWGNLDYGLRELSRRDGESEMEAYAWDLETNVMSSQKFTAKHIRDKRGGAEILRDERDIYELTANLGARRLRARILAILPPDLVDSAVEECRKTMAGSNVRPMADQVKDMTQAFAKLGISPDMLAVRLQHALDDTTSDELLDLREIYSSIKDGVSKPSDWFSARRDEAQEKPVSKLEALEQATEEKPKETPPPPEDKDTATAAGYISQIQNCVTREEVDALGRNPSIKKRLETFSPVLREAVMNAAEMRIKDLEVAGE